MLKIKDHNRKIIKKLSNLPIFSIPIRGSSRGVLNDRVP